jgi:hypothetical protein
MENQNLPQINVDSETLQKRQTAWAGLGQLVYTTELQLQAIAQQAILSSTIPQTIEQVSESELKIKALKKVQNDLIDRRKSITSKFDAKTQDLMKAEKSIDEPIKQLTDACITLKSAEAKRMKIEMDKQNEINTIKDKINSSLVSLEATYKSKIELAVNKCFESALVDKNLNPSEIGNYIDEILSKVKDEHFKITIPTIESKILTESEILEIANNLIAKFRKPSDFVLMYANAINDKFAFYEIAYNDKETAITKNKELESQKLKAIEKEKVNKEVASKLESLAVDVTVQPTLKKLKESYEVDLDETLPNAMLIISAFVANYDDCIKKIRVKPFNLSVGQMAKAIADLKSENNDFEVTGIKFRLIEKL